MTELEISEVWPRRPSSLVDFHTGFDYHTASKSSGFNVAFKYTPGRGYGGDVRPVGAGPAVSQMGRVPARHASPDNDVVGPDVAHHATGRHEGVPS